MNSLYVVGKKNPNTSSIYLISRRYFVGRLGWPARRRPSRLPQSRLGLLDSWNWYNWLIRIHLLLALFLVACASNSNLRDEYIENLKSKTGRQTSGQTVIVFLVDGLPVSTLMNQLQKGKLPHLGQYFFNNRSSTMWQARTTFPSLTFPAVSALLTETPVDQHGIYGNAILRKNEIIDFNQPVNATYLNDLTAGKTIFSRLRKKGLKTVNVDYNFNVDADATMKKDDVEVGVALLNYNYKFVDRKLIQSLLDLLKRTNTETWPDFVFIHLIGLDLTSHHYGFSSHEALEYLKYLDDELASIFKILDETEQKKQRKIIGLLTSDHGFDQEVFQTLDLEQVLKQKHPDIQILNEGHYLSLFFPNTWSKKKKHDLFDDIVVDPAIDLVAMKSKEMTVEIYSKQQSISLVYSGSDACPFHANKVSVIPEKNAVEDSLIFSCPDDLGSFENSLFYPYFVSNMAHFFASPEHPDGVIIAKPGNAFNKHDRGQHGGPTSQEVFVPVLLRNAVYRDNSKIPALWQLLEFL